MVFSILLSHLRIDFLHRPFQVSQDNAVSLDGKLQHVSDDIKMASDERICSWHDPDTGTHCTHLRDSRGKATAWRPYVCPTHLTAATQASKGAVRQLRPSLLEGAVPGVNQALSEDDADGLLSLITWVEPSNASRATQAFWVESSRVDGSGQSVTEYLRLPSVAAVVSRMLPEVRQQVGGATLYSPVLELCKQEFAQQKKG